MIPQLSRRECLKLAALAPLAGAAADPFEDWFRTILEGYLRNARLTSPSLAVCDFADGAIQPGACARSGKTYDSVTRMLPALAAWVVSGRGTDEHEAALLAVFRHAFDPAHPDYWLPSPPDKQQQRQVESSIVAWSLWLARDRVLPKLSSAERRNVQNWLASCTQVPVRNNNWAWFTAVNLGCRLALAPEWPEFSGDEAFLFEDLKFLDRLAMPGKEGWYTDSTKGGTFDYYNFWVFASHFLYWNRMVGERYPEWSRRFGMRLRAFLENVPLFYGANGSHILFGRSLIYRWADLTPLVLAYPQGFWPHSPGLLKAIARRNMEYLWNIGGFDAGRGKLRETLTPSGSTGIKESYIDNGHPYWGMQAFAMFLIPKSDPFWSVAEELLPVERGDFLHRFEDTKMLIAGSRKTGQVRLAQAGVGHYEPGYRDKYAKFSYSSHFPFCTAPLGQETKLPTRLDGVLAVRHRATGRLATQFGATGGRLTDKGLARDWWCELDGRRFTIHSEWMIRGDVEARRHEVSAPDGFADYELVEGSAALGLDMDGKFERDEGERWLCLRHAKHGVVFSQTRAGHQQFEVVMRGEGASVVYPRVAHILLVAPIAQARTVLESVHDSNPKPVDPAEIRRAVAEVKP